MAKFINRFWADEEGNTTIDWMVLTAGLILLGVAVMASIGTHTKNLASHTTTQINAINTGI